MTSGFHKWGFHTSGFHTLRCFEWECQHVFSCPSPPVATFWCHRSCGRAVGSDSYEWPFTGQPCEVDLAVNSPKALHLHSEVESQKLWWLQRTTTSGPWTHQREQSQNGANGGSNYSTACVVRWLDRCFSWNRRFPAWMVYSCFWESSSWKCRSSSSRTAELAENDGRCCKVRRPAILRRCSEWCSSTSGCCTTGGVCQDATPSCPSCESKGKGQCSSTPDEIHARAKQCSRWRPSSAGSARSIGDSADFNSWTSTYAPTSSCGPCYWYCRHGSWCGSWCGGVLGNEKNRKLAVWKN